MISMRLSLKVLPLLLIIIADIFYHFLESNPNDCPNGFFRLKPSDTCQQWLTCSDFDDMTALTLLSRGVVKKIYLYKYNDNYVIVSKLSDRRYADDFLQSQHILRQLSPNPFIVQLIGWCNEDVLITEYHAFGDATRLASILTETFQSNNFSVRLDLCLNYIRIIDFLHNSPIGVRVMCDSNTLEKTLSQYLVTNELGLVLNDLDALPQVVNEGVKCGPRQLFGQFVAPEQLWPYDRPFDDNAMKGYDHKTDVWKIPDVCHWFLTLGRNDSQFNSSVQRIERSLRNTIDGCKRADPRDRPSAREVLQSYSKVFEIFLAKIT